MTIFISVVSHGHSEVIRNLGNVSHLSNEFKIVVKNNLKDDSLDFLHEYDTVHVLNESYGLGFGCNNNYIFKYCCRELGMKDSDYFVVLNPDLFIDAEQLNSLISFMEEKNIFFTTANLYKDYEYSIYDNAIRVFPSFNQFLFSFLGLGNTAIIDKSIITEPCEVDWAAGSFLVFNSSLYSMLNGFDERYFMYCEDIDICYRSQKLGYPLMYVPNVKAIHLAEHENRNVFSKHFLWHVKSVFRFLLVKAGLVKS